MPPVLVPQKIDFLEFIFIQNISWKGKNICLNFNMGAFGTLANDF